MMRRLKMETSDGTFSLSVLSALLSVLSSEQAENGRQQRLERRLSDAGSRLE